MNTTTNPVHGGLRAWAKGLYPSEAAVELLIRTGFAHEGYPWVFECDGGGMWGIDWSAIPNNIGAKSGSERRLLLLAASIGGTVEVQVGECLSGLDRTNLALVLAAMAHANGSHEHSQTRMMPVEFPDGHGGKVTHMTRMPVRGGGYAPSLFPWPTEGDQ